MDWSLFQGLAAAAVNGTLILIVVLLVHKLLGAASASTRYLLLVGALISLLVLPVAAGFLPSWNIPLLPQPGVQAPTAGLPDAESKGSPGGQDQGADGSAGGLENPSGEPAGWWGAAAAGAVADCLPWILILVWIAGTATVLIIHLVRWAGAGFVAAMAAEVDIDWQKELAEKTRSELGVRREVTILRGELAAVTMAWGIKRPCLVLPAESRQWSREKLLAVLRHEFAHIKRNDNLMQMLSAVACAAYWFNPLVWIVMRRLHLEREVACDNEVLNSGQFASDYARHLMEISVRLTGPNSERLSPATMAHYSDIRRRLMTILNPKTNRRALSAGASAGLFVLLIAIALPVAAFRPWAGPPADAEPEIIRQPVLDDELLDRLVFVISATYEDIKEMAGGFIDRLDESTMLTVQRAYNRRVEAIEAQAIMARYRFRSGESLEVVVEDLREAFKIFLQDIALEVFDTIEDPSRRREFREACMDYLSVVRDFIDGKISRLQDVDSSELIDILDRIYAMMHEVVTESEAVIAAY